MSDEATRAALLDHYRKAWPGHAIHAFTPRAPFLPDLEVLRLQPPRNSGEEWVYGSLGASAATGRDGSRMEFFVLTQEKLDSCADLVAMMASFNADPEYGVQCGKIVDIGAPWVLASEADHLIVSLPYTLGPTFEWLHLPDGHVRFMWLVPVTRAEAAFAAREGTDALEQRLEAARAVVTHPYRGDVV